MVFGRSTLRIALSGIACSAIAYIGGVAVNPFSYEVMARELRQFADAPESTRAVRQEALDLAETFDRTKISLNGSNYVPLLDVFSGDLFRHEAMIRKLTPDRKPIIPLGR